MLACSYFIGVQSCIIVHPSRRLWKLVKDFSVFFSMFQKKIYNKCLSKKKRCTMSNMEPLHAFYQPNQSSFGKT